MQLNCLTDEELLRHARIEFDALTGTALEAELLRRFELYIDEADAVGPPLKVIRDHGFEDPVELDKTLKLASGLPPNVAELMDALGEYDIDDPAALRKQFDRIAKFNQAMQDLAEPLTTLQTLATTE